MNQHLNIGLRRMTENDYENMLQWRLDLDVRNFYGNPHETYTIEKVMEKYSPRVEGKDKKIPIIIEYNGNPVGYLQYYELELKEKENYGLSLVPVTYAMDVLIGNDKHRNKGIATQAIKLLQAYLKENTQVQKIVLKLIKENQSAIKCYEKCGFRIIKELKKNLLLMGYYYPI